MSIQLLVNVLRVPATGSLAPGDSVIVAHGLLSNDEAVRPTLIQPNQATPIIVVSANATSVTFQNSGSSPASATFRFERGLSNEVDAETVGDLFWRGALDGSSGVSSVAVTDPIENTGTVVNPIIGLANSGVVAGTYGDPAASPEAVTPAVTVTAKGLVSNVTTGSIKIGGSTAKSYVDAGDAATLAAANAFAESLAFGISSKDPVHTASTAALPANTADVTFQILTASANGVLPAIGGHTLTVGQRVLIKNEAIQQNNGIYVVTSLGANDPGGSPWVLTRASDANTANELCGSMVPVETGTLANTVWIFAANSSTFDFGITPVIWTELSVGAATTTTLGTVQLAGGLGGVGTAANSPKLDMGSATSGTLARERGGTGLASAGAAGNVLTSDGTNWASAPIPNVKIARTYFVAINGNDLTGDGSINKPFATIDAAEQQSFIDSVPSADYVKIVVGPGTYTGDVVLQRPRLIVEGAGSRPETYATVISGTVYINPGSATDKYQDTILVSGFFVQPPGGSGAFALDIQGAGLFQLIATDCYFTTNSSVGGVAVNDATSNPGRPRIFLQDCILSVQQTGPQKIVGITNADFRIFRSQVGHASTVTLNGNPVVQISGAGTLWADSTIFEGRTSVQPTIATSLGSSPTPPDVRLLLSNCSVANTLSGGGVSLSSVTTALFIGTTFNVPTSAAYVISGTGTLSYANLTFLPSTETAIQPTLSAANAATELHGQLLLPAIGAGVLTKSTAAGTVSVVAPTVAGNVLTANGTAWVSATPVGPGLIPLPASVAAGLTEGKAVAINNVGQLTLADCTNTNAAPAVGFYTEVGGVGYIRIAGAQSMGGPLTVGNFHYLGTAGNVTALPPTGSGKVVQVLGRATTSTNLFVSLTNIITN